MILSFVLAASTYPECISIAQKEIDAVTQGRRLPTLADRDQLPYSKFVTWFRIRPSDATD